MFFALPTGMMKITGDRNGNAVPGDCNILSTKKNEDNDVWLTQKVGLRYNNLERNMEEWSLGFICPLFDRSRWYIKD
jgi:hypothetical protein